MPRAVKGVLVECDPSIKAIILKIDKDSGHGYIVEDLDDETLVVKEPKLAELKLRLEKILERTQMLEKDEESDPENPG
ncbi:TFIIH subunit TTDA/Tfb5 [Tuber brumale]|nr:TFIIH subunit TTDA/Tfb5 [Tuber brumale]